MEIEKWKNGKMEKLSSISRKDALFAIPYDVKRFRLTTEKIERGEEVTHSIKKEEVVRLSTAWDYPQLSIAEVIEILKNDRSDFPQKIINDIQSRAVGMVSATYVIPFIGEKRYIELAKKHKERVASDIL